MVHLAFSFFLSPKFYQTQFTQHTFVQLTWKNYLPTNSFIISPYIYNFKIFYLYVLHAVIDWGVVEIPRKMVLNNIMDEYKYA